MFSIWTAQLPPTLALKIEGVRHVARSTVREPSGLVRSRRHPNIYWTHGDHGEPADIVGITAEGAFAGRFVVKGADNVDWEAIAIDDDGFLYVADFGCNHEDRSDFTIYKISEPDPSQKSGSVDAVAKILFDYPDRPRPGPLRNINFDAEALFHQDGSLYVLSKHRADTKTTLYRVPPEATAQPIILERIGEFDVGGADRPYGGMVSSADLDPKSGRLAVLSYHALFIFETRPTESPLKHLLARVDLDQSQLKQCEALAWTDSGVLVLNEDGDMFEVRIDR